jgi:hypothetical protein
MLAIRSRCPNPRASPDLHHPAEARCGQRGIVPTRKDAACVCKTLGGPQYCGWCSGCPHRGHVLCLAPSRPTSGAADAQSIRAVRLGCGMGIVGRPGAVCCPDPRPHPLRAPRVGHTVRAGPGSRERPTLATTHRPYAGVGWDRVHRLYRAPSGPGRPGSARTGTIRQLCGGGSHSRGGCPAVVCPAASRAPRPPWAPAPYRRGRPTRSPRRIALSAGSVPKLTARRARRRADTPLLRSCADASHLDAPDQRSSLHASRCTRADATRGASWYTDISRPYTR